MACTTNVGQDHQGDLRENIKTNGKGDDGIQHNQIHNAYTV